MGGQYFSLARLAERWFGPWPVQLAWFLLFALVTRWTMLGDPNYHDDETLFFLIGQRMLDGAIPYVDVWDRKGPGLFALFAGFAAISDSVLSYQIGALVFAALTAFVLARIAHRHTGWLGAMLAGTMYLAVLPRVMGGGGQAGVYFNLPVIIAAWLVLARPPARGPTRASLAAMLLCGLAITFKQTVIFDGGFLGLLLLWQHWRAGARPAELAKAASFYAAAGALPMLAFAAIYAGLGHFAEFWHAMVLSNLAKQYDAGNDIPTRVFAMAFLLLPLLVPAVLGLTRAREYDGKTMPRGAMLGWLAATLAALVAIPNFIDHYLIPVVLVLSLCAAPFLQREPWGPVLGLLGLAVMLSFGPQFDRATRIESRQAMTRLAGQIAVDRPEPRLFLFQGPVALYSMTGSYPPTPLLFPLHLEAMPERNVSHLDTAGEVSRVLAWQPTTVLVRAERHSSENPETFALVDAWVRAHCGSVKTWNLPNRYGQRLYDVWSDCRVDQAPR
ncbi:ArnT family glycosyltransferase [Alteraurantiacibacter buctensis]|uniref:Glycosyltransferase RgtA/B/C/D-like domain-containing protein n=1 Tax=Alteraurantiacibacter buctensis TaxID=1503981 RepID=A0A844Z023_9SPHN|nr:hypothetical protein [Alteraurantiacibacter buctensis]MXO72596.1 hypothetical protein [Alteraurantiacibacter buctensis]